jgi:hypothetical protein
MGGGGMTVDCAAAPWPKRHTLNTMAATQKRIERSIKCFDNLDLAHEGARKKGLQNRERGRPEMAILQMDASRAQRGS